MKKNTIWVIIIIIILIIGTGLIFWGGGTNEPEVQDNLENQLGQMVSPPPEGTPQVVSFIVGGSNYKFVPSELRVKQGARVRVTFSNEGGTHDFKIDEFNVATQILQTGQSETVEFTADKKGTFEYYCSVGNHRQMGMRGNLIVE